ncbi:MAG: ABC transporter ATP-binding protein [bacterium]
MLAAKDLVKRFGERTALHGLTFEVPTGSIVGFLGPNGAGKTTTMRILTGYLSPTSGTAQVAGYEVTREPLKVKERVGYMPENPPVHPEMTVLEFLDFVSDIKKVPKQVKRDRMQAVIEQTSIGDVRKRIIGRLSKGYRQRVGLAQALVHEPEVLILDEPTAGLDPKQIIEIRNLIKTLGRDRTVLLSTHILPEVTQTCDRAIIIHQGSIVAQDALDHLSTQIRGAMKVRVRVRRDADDLVRKLVDLDGVKCASLGGGDVWVQFQPGLDVREEVARVAVNGNYGLTDLTAQTATLEEVFLQLTTEENAA